MGKRNVAESGPSLRSGPARREERGTPAVGWAAGQGLEVESDVAQRCADFQQSPGGLPEKWENVALIDAADLPAAAGERALVGEVDAAMGREGCEDKRAGVSPQAGGAGDTGGKKRAGKILGVFKEPVEV